MIGVFTFVGLAATLWVALLVREYIAVLVLGVVIGTTLGPLVDWLARYRMPRILSGFLVYALIASLLSLFLLYAIPELAQEGQELIDSFDDLQPLYEDLGEVIPLPEWDELGPLFRERMDEFAGRIAGEVVSQAGAVVAAVLYTFTVFVVGLFWTITREPARQLFLSLLEERHRAKADETLSLLANRIRKYVLAEFAGMVTVGVITYIGLSLLGVPFAFVLAAIAFVLEILPILGPWIAFIPALLVSLGEGWQTAIFVSVFYLALQQLEGNVIVPVFQGRGTGLPQLLILYAVLLGGALMGVLGALVAIPVAVVAYTIFMDVFVPWRQERVGTGPGPQPPAEGAEAD